MVCWQVVELRSPAKEGADVFVSTNLYYEWWCTYGYYWNGNENICDSGYSYSVNFGNTLGESYQISSDSGLLPIDIPPLFTLLECTQLTGPLCTGSGIPPNGTLPGAPPLMIGAGPCELPFLVWQVETALHSTHGLRTCQLLIKISSQFIPAALDCICFLLWIYNQPVEQDI